MTILLKKCLRYWVLTKFVLLFPATVSLSVKVFGLVQKRAFFNERDVYEAVGASAKDNHQVQSAFLQYFGTRENVRLHDGSKYVSACTMRRWSVCFTWAAGIWLWTVLGMWGKVETDHRFYDMITNRNMYYMYQELCFNIFRHDWNVLM